ncbi:MAG: AEC family transporter [Campylobacterales bacterium]
MSEENSRYNALNKSFIDIRFVWMIEQLLPIMLLFVTGVVARRLGHGHSVALVDFILYFSFPALILQKMRFAQIGFESIKIVLFAWLAILSGLLLGWLGGRLMGLDRGRLAALMLVSALGNTSFLGFPMIEAFYGEEGLTGAILYDQFGSFLALMILGTIILSWGGGERASMTTILKRIALFPPFIAMIVALLLHGVRFPAPVERLVEMLAATLLPLVVVAVGMRLSFGALRLDVKPIAWALMVKMVVVPAIVWMVLKIGGGAPWSGVIVAESAMPAMVMVAVLAMRAGMAAELALGAVGIGMLASFIVIPLWIALAG